VKFRKKIEVKKIDVKKSPPPSPPKGGKFRKKEEDLCSQLFGHPYFTFN
jgi:hypothetical protein